MGRNRRSNRNNNTIHLCIEECPCDVKQKIRNKIDEDMRKSINVFGYINKDILILIFEVMSLQSDAVSINSLPRVCTRWRDIIYNYYKKKYSVHSPEVITQAMKFRYMFVIGKYILCDTYTLLTEWFLTSLASSGSGLLVDNLCTRFIKSYNCNSLFKRPNSSTYHIAQTYGKKNNLQNYAYGGAWFMLLMEKSFYYGNVPAINALMNFTEYPAEGYWTHFYMLACRQGHFYIFDRMCEHATNEARAVGYCDVRELISLACTWKNPAFIEKVFAYSKIHICNLLPRTIWDILYLCVELNYSPLQSYVQQRYNRMDLFKLENVIAGEFCKYDESDCVIKNMIHLGLICVEPDKPWL